MGGEYDMCEFTPREVEQEEGLIERKVKCFMYIVINAPSNFKAEYI